MRLRLLPLAALVAASLSFSTATAQTTHTVDQVGLTFVPDTLTIAPGDTVEWVWTGGPHTVTSGAGCIPDGLFDLPLDSLSPLASFTFNSVGDFDYYCIPHCSVGMTGVITVEAGTPVPAVPAWGLVVVGLALATTGSVLIRRLRKPSLA